MTSARASGARRLALAAVAVLAVLAAGAGCGLSAESKPRVIASANLPSGLLAPSPSSSTTLAQSPATTSITVYFLVQRDSVSRLVAARREVKIGDGAQGRIAALLTHPTPEEQAQGLLTSIPADTVLIGTQQNADELVVNLSKSLFDIQGQELRNAFAQLVWTATEVPGISRVRFQVAGKDYRVPDQDGIEQPGAVSRSDYANLAPAPVPTTPTVPGAATTAGAAVPTTAPITSTTVPGLLVP